MEDAVRSGNLQSVITLYNNGTLTDVYTMLYGSSWWSFRYCYMVT